MKEFYFWKKEILTEMKEGKLRKLLKIPEGKSIDDVYSSGNKLAKDLLKKVSYKNAIRMLVFASNMNKENKILKRALNACKIMKPED